MKEIIISLFVVMAFATVSDAVAQPTTGASMRTPTTPTEQSSASTGWFILNGEFIPGPYNVTVVNDAIEINGLATEPSPRPQPQVTAEANRGAHHELLESLLTNFRTWEAEDGLDAARQQAFEFMRAQQIVEHADWADGSDLVVRFRGEKYEEHVSLQPSYEPEFSAGETRRRYLEDRANSFDFWLTHGCLLSINDGVVFATPPSEGETSFYKFQEIRSAIGNVEDRVVAIRQVIPDKEMARAIAERFKLN